jgi:hypothetical protein
VLIQVSSSGSFNYEKMSKIKKVLIALVILVLIFPAAAGAQGFSFSSGSSGFSIGASGNGFSFSFGSGGGIGALAGLGLPGGSIYGIIRNLVFWLLGLFAFFGIIGFTVSGIMYLVSAGNDEMITKAKKYMLYSIVGVIVGLMGMVIIQAAFWMLGGASTTF